MTIRTRFAPSPTGFLHIGGARTALFNWLYAKHYAQQDGAEFLLRIEDTDRKRSTQEAVDALQQGLSWLGIVPDQPPVFQHQQQARHQEVAAQLLEEGKAYHCYCTPQELQTLREQAQAEKRVFRYPGIWRERDPKEAPEGVLPTLRLKTPHTGNITLEDGIKGRVTVEYSEIDDMVLLRADGTPTYMLAVVVDDHDMEISHIMRGDDHFTNSFRQVALYEALGWDVPKMTHLPLIHGADGAKMSKRHGALGVHEYEALGILPEALNNYLLRLGWSHGDEEIISQAQAIAWFDGTHLGSAPARFDLDKLHHLNAHYLQKADPQRLISLLEPIYGRTLSNIERGYFSQGLTALLPRVSTLLELAEAGRFYLERGQYDEKAAGFVQEGGAVIAEIATQCAALELWDEASLDGLIKTYVKEKGLKFPAVGMPLRVALTGSTQSPSVGHVMAVLGKEEALRRLQNL